MCPPNYYYYRNMFLLIFFIKYFFRYNIGKAPDWYIKSLKDFLVLQREYTSEEAQLYIKQIISKIKKETCLEDGLICYRDDS